MKKLLLSLIPLALPLIAFFMLWQTFARPHHDYYEGKNAYPFGEGNAPAGMRDSIMSQLEFLEKGYLERDVKKLAAYCERLISREEILILGTMPREIYRGYEQATELIRTDWLYWGDVHYLMEQSSVSVHGGVAWVSTIGYVEFDISRYLVLPLRFSGVMVREEGLWKFQQMQFQFDLDNAKILITLIILLAGSLFFFIRFVVFAFRLALVGKTKK